MCSIEILKSNEGDLSLKSNQGVTSSLDRFFQERRRMARWGNPERRRRNRARKQREFLLPGKNDDMIFGARRWDPLLAGLELVSRVTVLGGGDQLAFIASWDKKDNDAFRAHACSCQPYHLTQLLCRQPPDFKSERNCSLMSTSRFLPSLIIGPHTTFCGRHGDKEFTDELNYSSEYQGILIHWKTPFLWAFWDQIKTEAGSK